MIGIGLVLTVGTGLFLADQCREPTGYLHLKDVMDLMAEQQFHEAVPAQRNRALASAARSSETEDS